MSRATAGPSRWHWHTGQGARLLLLSLSLGIVPSCLDSHLPRTGPFTLPFDGPSVLEGEVTLKDGEEAQVHYPRPFQVPPQLAIVELRESRFEERPYKKGDFQFLRQEATGFTIRNTHAERNPYPWATVKWRAEGVAGDPPAAPNARPVPPVSGGKIASEQVEAFIKGLGGKVTVDTTRPDRPVVAIDLHLTQAADADLESLRTQATLRSLNLYGTRITDAGLKPVGALTGLQSLDLNETAVTDAGLQHLQRLTQLKELRLYHTHVSDDGFSSLHSLTSLQNLTLSGPQISDRGLVQLKGLHNLKQLLLYQTHVTATGIQELKKAVPGVQIIH